MWTIAVSKSEKTDWVIMCVALTEMDRSTYPTRLFMMFLDGCQLRFAVGAPY